MPRGMWTENQRERAAKWNVSKNDAKARWRREFPSKSLSRLRAVLTDRMRWPIIELEHRAGPRPFWFKAWVQLPDGREAGIDIIWDSGHKLEPKHLALVAAKREWMEAEGHPYIYLMRRKPPEIEMDLRNWWRKISKVGVSPGAKDPGQPAPPAPDHPA